MQIRSVMELLQASAACVTVLCFILFAWVLFLRSHGARARRRDPASIAGVALHSIAFAIAFGVRRSTFSAMTPRHPVLGAALAALEVALAVVSVWLSIAAVRILGPEWSLQARLIEGHRLVTSGPYAIVRHPIYTGMFGMLLATLLAFAHGIALVPAVVLYGAGTILRVRGEERLLRVAFGAAWDDYARRVPAVLPGWR